MDFNTSCEIPPGDQERVKQLFKIIRLSSFLTLLICLNICAIAKSQTSVTLSIKNGSLESVLKEIRKQTGYFYSFQDQWKEKAKTIDISVSNVSIEEALNICFSNQPFTYAIIGKTIVVKAGSASGEKTENINSIKFIDIHGKVVDENDKPVTGVSVVIKGTKKGTSTDEKGEFILSTVSADATLIFTGSTVETFELYVNARMNINVRLKAKISGLDEVQIIAYGQTTKRFQTGNVTTVKAEDIEKQPVSNPLLALEGRVPGLFITQNSGLPGTGVTVRIQGQNSMANGNDPLYVVDGIPYTSQVLPSINQILGGSGAAGSTPAGSGNPLSFINPSDIESIDVLKDADATAIYGSRAANGAILITTKKGKSGQTKADITLQNGWGKITGMLPLLNTKQYLVVRHEAFNNDNATPQPTDNDINGLWDTTRNTNWQKALIGGTAQYIDGQASISGGTANTQFLVGSNYHKETTVFPGSLEDQKSSIHFGLNNLSLNQKLHLQFSGSYLTDNNRLQAVDPTNTALSLPPDAPNLYTSDGGLNWMPDANGVSSWTNPLSNQVGKYSIKTTNLLGNAIVGYTILKDLDFKSSFGYTTLEQNEFQGFPLLFFAPDARPTATRSATYANSILNTWIVEPQLSFKHAIEKGKLDLLLGSTFEKNSSHREQFQGTGYNSDAVLEDIQSASKVTVSSTLDAIYKYNALFGRLNYLWNNKYIINLNARRDGSSRFGANNQFHNFASIGVAWIFWELPYIKDHLSIISFGKLRASFGTTGNDQIGDYSFLSRYSPYGVATPYRGVSALLPNSISNPDLQWEETKKLQAGMELGLFKDRILFISNYSTNRSSNQLLAYALPSNTGFTYIPAVNFPATVQNSEWEISVKTENMKSKKFSWISNINITIPKNKLIAFPNIASSSYSNNYLIGKSVNSVKVFHLFGVDPATGLYSAMDRYGKPTFFPDFSSDNTVVLDMSPKFYGAVENKLSYQGIELDILFQFTKQIGPSYFFGGIPGQAQNQPTTVLNRWRKPGDIAPIQRYATGNVFAPLITSFTATYSDVAYSDASYVRLKNISLSWQLPDKLDKRAHLQYCRFFIHGQNLLTITNFVGLDPENHSTASLPPLRIITIGLQMGL